MFLQVDAIERDFMPRLAQLVSPYGRQRAFWVCIAATILAKVTTIFFNGPLNAVQSTVDDATRDFHIDVNIKGVWNTCKAVIPYMLKQGGGNIVIASSVTGDIVADAGEAAYAMTKAALVGLTKCLAVEYADRNIRVNCSQLGYARTPMVDKMALESNPSDPESAIADIAAGVPMKRLANPIEVGELFAFLGSDESSYLTGSQIVIDGGSTLPETMSIGTN